MKIKEANLEPEIEKLLRNFSFEELSLTDRALVLQSMTQQTYQAYRQIVLGAESIFAKNEKSPSEKIKENLDRAFQQQFHPPTLTIWEKFIQYKMPAWHAGLACASILLFFMAKGERIVEIEVPKEIYVYETDTVYKELSIPFKVNEGSKTKKELDTIAQKTNVKPGSKRNLPPMTAKREDQYFEEAKHFGHDSIHRSRSTGQEQSLEKTMKEHPELKEFLVKIY